MRSMIYRSWSALLGLGLLLAFGSAANAQSSRTWVSSGGDDLNTCSRTAPCKTFAGALSKTSAGGIINVVDNGAYGPVTITQSVTIQSDESFAGILLADGVTGIIVNAGDKDIVVLRGLSIDGQGLGIDGIRFLNGLSLTIENCLINRVTQKGINFSPAGGSQLYVKNTVIRNNNFNAGAGIVIQPGDAGSAEVTIDHVQIERNALGIEVDNHSKVSIRDSEISRSASDGIRAHSTLDVKGNVLVNVVGTLVNLNTGSGVKADGGGAILRIADTSIFDNGGTGINPVNGGVINSFGNNNNAGNNPDGAPTAPTLSQQ
ncbi:MAG TPA: right-handed parallel beta-helix repeat-containing protein [Thermoanaerobaculia bacterium]|nr:right-handed parallel beta-helix repeat-containing protein [Thermoanaerobaculia bacterium]